MIKAVLQAVVEFMRAPYTAPWDDLGQFLQQFGITLAVCFVVAALAVEFGCFRHGENDR
jgi:hypothetical protein